MLFRSRGVIEPRAMIMLGSVHLIFKPLPDLYIVATPRPASVPSGSSSVAEFDTISSNAISLCIPPQNIGDSGSVALLIPYVASLHAW